MKLSILKLKSQKRGLARRCLALLMALSVFAALDLPVVPTVGAANVEDAIMPLADPNKTLLASFDFEDGSLTDLSGRDVKAELLGPDASYIIDTGNNGAEESNGYLDLTGSDAYLSLSGGIFNASDEMTVEMCVFAADTSANRAFFAAPKEESPENYLSILLNNNSVTVERYADSKEGSKELLSGSLPANEWHRIRVVFGKSAGALYIDGNKIDEAEWEFSLADHLGENGFFRFGNAL